MKFLRPTNSPGLPTLMLDSENHTPITNGYAMKAPSRTTVGLRRANARSRSFSRRRSNARRCAVLGCESATSTRAALPAPPAIGFFKPMTCRSGFVDLLQFAFGPLHSVLVQPLQKVLGELLILRVLHHGVLERQVQGELTSRAFRHQRGVLDVLEERLTLLVLDLVLLALGHDVNRRAIERRADLTGVE